MFDGDIQRLKAVPLLSVLDDIALHHLIFNSERKSAPDGMNLFVEGDFANGAVFLESGKLSLSSFLKGEIVERVVLEPGAIVDPYSLISSGKRPVTAKALGDVEYREFDRPTFLKVLENYPGHAERLQDFLRDEIAKTVGTLNGVAARLDFIQ